MTNADALHMRHFVAHNFHSAVVRLDVRSCDSYAVPAVVRMEYHDAIVVGELTVQSTAGADGVHQFNRHISGLLHVAIDADNQAQRDSLGRIQPLPLLCTTYADEAKRYHNGLQR